MLTTHAYHSPFDYDRPNYTVHTQYREAVSHRHSKCRTPRPTPHRERGGRSGGKRARHFRKRQSACEHGSCQTEEGLFRLFPSILLKTTKSSILALGHIKTENKSQFPDISGSSLTKPLLPLHMACCHVSVISSTKKTQDCS